MELDQELLRELHRIHRQAEDLEGQIEQGPRQLIASEKRLAQAEEQLDAAREKRTQTRLLADQKQLLMQEREARIEKIQGNLNTCSSNKEFQMFKDQIAAEQQANEVLADEIFELLERIDTEAVEIKSSESAVEQARTDNAATVEKIAEEKARLESELDRVNGMLDNAQRRLPEGFRDDYYRLVKGKGTDALAQVEDECCGSCFQTLTVQVFSNLYMSKPVFCSACGSVLYLPENHKVR